MANEPRDWLPSISAKVGFLLDLFFSTPTNPHFGLKRGLPVLIFISDSIISMSKTKINYTWPKKIISLARTHLGAEK